MDSINYTKSVPKEIANMSVLNTIKEKMLFTWIDYTLFSCMFLFSALIGIYFGCFGSKQKSFKDYMLGGRSMKVIPVAISLTASNLSGITLLGIPAEIYMYGTQYYMFVISSCFVATAMILLYLPVFYKLQLQSGYEYLKLRFDDRIRNIASTIFVLKTFLYVPIVVYIPALAFNQVSGINIHLITPIVCLICVFYTTIGGLKGVVWTDTLQFTVTMATLLTINILGVDAEGGLSNIWKKSSESGRIEFFNLDFDPTSRTTFWGVVIGVSFTWTGHFGVHQSSIQRYLSLPSLKKANLAVLLFTGGVIFTKTSSCLSGLIMYARYRNCDPILSGSVKSMDQLLPFYVMEVANKLPGLSGIFISGVFSTALSSMSTSLNTLAGTIYTDFILPRRENTYWKSTNIMKVLVVVVGIISICLVFLIEQMGGVLQIAFSFFGITGGPLMGLFTLGMLFPSANAKGALCGSVSSILIVGTMCLGQQYHLYKGNIRYTPKPRSIEGCSKLFNETVLLSDINSNTVEPFWLFRVSFLWYSVLGVTIVILVGLIVSYFTKEEDAVTIDRDLLSPLIYWTLPKENVYNLDRRFTLESEEELKVKEKLLMKGIL